MRRATVQSGQCIDHGRSLLCAEQTGEVCVKVRQVKGGGGFEHRLTVLGQLDERRASI